VKSFWIHRTWLSTESQKPLGSPSFGSLILHLSEHISHPTEMVCLLAHLPITWLTL
jgi:hypothetical protein